MEPTQTVCVVGLGYIGLPTAAILASNGNEVIGVDIDADAVEHVNAGRVPFVEPDLEAVVAGVVAQGRLRATTEMPAAGTYILAVPTPFDADMDVDVSYILAAAERIAPLLSGGELIVLESTSPPGTTDRLADFLLARRPDLADAAGSDRELLFAHCPERVLPGRIMVELTTNDRIIGGRTPRAAERARDLYATFCHGVIHLTDARTAELAKLAENAYRDVNIAFANELSLVSRRLGIDAHDLIALANHHPRVNILQPGVGVGGHCIAVDPWFIIAAAPEEAKLMRTARDVNLGKTSVVVDDVVRRLEGEQRAAFLGLTFKADVGDTRNSPALQIVAAVARRLPDLQLQVVDPWVEALPDELRRSGNVELVGDLAAVDAGAPRVLLVAHTQFASAGLPVDRVPAFMD